jgi:hypothetical protein
MARADRRQAVERHAQRSGAGLRGLTGKDHAPGQVGGAAPELGIDEIRDRPSPMPMATTIAMASAICSGGAPMRRQKIQRGHGHADQPAVEGHAALPDAQDRQGVGQVSARLVEQRVSHAPADDDAEDDGGQEPLHLRGRHGRGVRGPELRSLHRARDDPPARQQAHDIGQRVPAQREPEIADGDREDLGRDIGKRDGQKHRPRVLCLSRHVLWPEGMLGGRGEVNLDPGPGRGHIRTREQWRPRCRHVTGSWKMSAS